MYAHTRALNAETLIEPADCWLVDRRAMKGLRMKLTMSSWDDGDGRWDSWRVAIQRQSTPLVEETSNRGRGRGNPPIMEPELDPARARAERIAAGIQAEEVNGRCLLALACGRGCSCGRP